MQSDDELTSLIQGCESERLHEIGSIQPTGVLLAGALGGSVIRAVSANAQQFLDEEPSHFLDRSMADVLPDLSLQIAGSAGDKHYLTGLFNGPAGPLDGVLSLGDASWLLELEPAADEGGFATVNTSLGSLLTQPRSAAAWQDYMQRAVDLFRELTGFDRVMLYRFLDDGSGEVTAEAGSGAYDSYLGLRFPASDIPQIARNLYVKNPHRLIADVEAEAVPIMAIDDGSTPDLTYSDLRAVSPVHIQYLKNMEVTASLSFSIKGGGKLWGLFACHHRSPRYLDYAIRSRCAEVANAFALGMMAYGSNLRLAYINSVDQDIERAVEAIQAFEDGDGRRGDLGRAVLELVDADGAALIDQHGVYCFGTCPSSAFIEDFDRWILDEVKDEIFATDCLAEHLAAGVEHARLASGVLALQSGGPLKLQHGNLRLYWFRGEVPQTVKWAGDPRKAVDQSTGRQMLSPRNSFDLYLEETRYRSAPWSETDLMTAKKSRSLLLHRFSCAFAAE